jgi:hypothetical protein
MQAGIEWSKTEARRQGLKREHFCDYLLFLDADQVVCRDHNLRYFVHCWYCNTHTVQRYMTARLQMHMPH